MKLEQFMYLDSLSIASLYAQLRGEDVVETIYGTEDTRIGGLKLAINAFLGGSAESSKSQKEMRTRKAIMRPENMLREIVTSLRANGSLHLALASAIRAIPSSNSQVFFEARHFFNVPLPLGVFNKTKHVMFLSGFPPYDEPSPTKPKISMSANLSKFPSIHNDYLSPSGHDGLFFTKLNGRAHEYTVFGKITSVGDEYQVKPFAIRS